jgi:hypothetical protein
MRENSTDDEDVRVYAGIANRLTGLLSTWTEYDAALTMLAFRFTACTT